MDISRRDFINTTTASAIGIGIAPVPILRGVKIGDISQVSIFSKYLGFLDYNQLGEVVARLGFNGVDLAVRKGGHVLPENVKNDLPLAVKSLKKAGISIPMIVTDIVEADNEYTESILSAAANQDIKYYRMGYYRYDPSLSVTKNLEISRQKLEKLEKLNKKYDIKGCYQNHSGTNGFVGGPLWDLHYMLKGFSPENIGVQFDIMHASVEGGYTWPISLNLLAPWINSLALMDFSWIGLGQQKSQAVPLGKGTVDFEKCIAEMRQIEFSGPITIKCEHLTEATRQRPMTNLAQKMIYSKLEDDLNYYRDYISWHK